VRVVAGWLHFRPAARVCRTLPVHPLLIDTAAVQIGSGRAVTYLAVLLCVVLAPGWAARREGLDPRRVRWSLLVLALVVLGGGRFHFVMNHPEFYPDGWARALTPTGGGFHIGGGIAALALAAPFVTRWLGLPLARFADALVFPLGIAIGVARLGCFLHGCCFGEVCTRPWCLAFPPASAVFGFHRELHLVPPDATHSLPVHPLQLYFIAAAVGVAAVGYWGERRKRYDGEVALFGLALFSTTTVLIELLRAADGSSPIWGPLPQLVWTGLALVAASATGLCLGEAAHRSRTTAGAAM